MAVLAGWLGLLWRRFYVTWNKSSVSCFRFQSPRWREKRGTKISRLSSSAHSRIHLCQSVCLSVWTLCKTEMGSARNILDWLWLQKKNMQKNSKDSKWFVCPIMLKQNLYHIRSNGPRHKHIHYFQTNWLREWEREKGRFLQRRRSSNPINLKTSFSHEWHETDCRLGYLCMYVLLCAL